MIDKNTKMLLFRYSNYKKHSFIDEHIKVISERDYVWMMKMGKRTSISKIEAIMEKGGYIILKSPVSDGNVFYIGRFIAFCEELPNDDEHMPGYYSEIVEDDEFWDLPTQFFKINKIFPLPQEYANELILEKNKRRVVDVVNETRTAVMYIENQADFNIKLMP